MSTVDLRKISGWHFPYVKGLAMAYLMGIDLGTSSVKTIIIDLQGKLMAVSSQSYNISVPMEGRAEQSPEKWWEACSQTIQNCIENSSIKPKDICGIGLSGQMHGTVIIDDKKRPIRPAIIHFDQRAIKDAQEIKEILGEDYIRENIMNPIFSGFQLVSLYWMKKVEPEYFANIYKVILPKDYIRLKLTGEIATDYTDASGTLAFHLKKREWNKDVLEKLDIPQDIFPKCFTPYEVTGYVTREAAENTGLAVGTPVVGGGGDQIMQAIGNGVVTPGAATVTIGTSGQVFFPVHAPILNKALNTHLFCGALPDSWFIMGAILNAGLCLDWFTNKVFPDNGIYFYDIDEKLKMFGQGNGGIVFLPYLTGERTPHM
ncbi:MAG: xylulokinase, partial [Thermoplasmata archaeon]|nr:xylulokinase [Thermoplasmata archaeon]